MQSTEAAAAEPSLPPSVPLPTLLAAFARVPDPRRAQGRRYSVAAILTLAVAAILANHRTEQAIAEWGADQPAAVRRALGFATGRTPHQSTIQRLFRRLAIARLSAAVETAVAAAVTPPLARGAQGVAVDGKAQRGRLAFESDGSPVHALTAFLHEPGLVLAQVAIGGQDEAAATDKATAELTAAPILLARLDWHGRVLTADALLCQRSLAQQVVAAGGDYLLCVKDNQPTLAEDLRTLFDPSPAVAALGPLTDQRRARTVEKGHGRLEIRQLVASTDLVGFSDWPALAQAFRLERTWTEHGQQHREVRYGITSLPPAVAGPARLLALARGHWTIENQLHLVKDVTLGEDQSLLHCGAGPMIVAILRDTVISLLRHSGQRHIAQALRYFSRHPEAACALLGLSIS